MLLRAPGQILARGDEQLVSHCLGKSLQGTVPGSKQFSAWLFSELFLNIVGFVVVSQVTMMALSQHEVSVARC